MNLRRLKLKIGIALLAPLAWLFWRAAAWRAELETALENEEAEL